MFDMKKDDNLSQTTEAEKNSQLMEALDVFISVKLKQKQSSKVGIRLRFLIKE